MFIVGINNGRREILTVLGNKKSIVSCGKIWIMEYYWSQTREKCD